MICRPYVIDSSKLHSPHTLLFKFKFMFPSTSCWQIHEMEIYFEIKLIKKVCQLPTELHINISFVTSESYGALRAADKIRAKLMCRDGRSKRTF